MNTEGLAKLDDTLTPRERLPLITAAAARARSSRDWVTIRRPTSKARRQRDAARKLCILECEVHTPAGVEPRQRRGGSCRARYRV